MASSARDRLQVEIVCVGAERVRASRLFANFRSEVFSEGPLISHYYLNWRKKSIQNELTEKKHFLLCLSHSEAINLKGFRRIQSNFWAMELRSWKCPEKVKSISPCVCRLLADALRKSRYLLNNTKIWSGMFLELLEIRYLALRGELLRRFRQNWSFFCPDFEPKKARSCFNFKGSQKFRFLGL